MSANQEFPNIDLIFPITIGQNGLIVLKSESGSNLDKIIKIFKMLDSTTDDSNMDEKIQKILDENN